MGFTLHLGLFLSCVFSAVSASAPGDTDTFCANLPDTFSAPIFPPNSRILMDSFNYVNLLPPHSGAVWQEVDNDDNNVEGRGTSWSQNSNSPCRQTANVCGLQLGTQDNWLITQYINRRVNGTSLPQVSVLVEFELRGCTELVCQRTFVINKYETSTADNATARDTGSYVIVDRVSTTDDSGETRQNRTREIDFDTDVDGFYLSIRDETTCIAVTRVIVFYHICPGETEGLVMRPETLAPLIDRLSPPLEVTVECVDGTSPENGVASKLNCNQGGVWTPISGSRCRCDEGTFTSVDGQSCTGCGAGMYLSGQVCTVCPNNSMSMEAGLAECPCVEDYYRAPGEEDLPCTQPPSSPRNVRVESQTSNSITLIWDPPDFLGNRNDTQYQLFYQKVGSTEKEFSHTVNITEGIITGLEEGVEYSVFVRAVNGVGGSEEEVPLTVLTLRSPDTTTPIVVGVVIAAIVVILLVLISLVAAIIFYREFFRSKYDVKAHEAIPIPVNRHRTYVDPTTYATVDEAIEEFAQEIEPKLLRLDSEIGAGEFGTVFRGIWKEQPKKQVAVAVKTLKPGSSVRMRSDFLNEATIMGQFNHDHVIKLYGVVTRVDPAMIVMEFMDNGSLYSYLRKNDEKLDTQKLLQMSRFVCSGMEYLATVGFVHRDLAARNVLVSRDEVCKVADFGLSREVIDDEYNVQTGGKIPVRWTAPEAIYRRKFTSSSDVWSFGVLMWEVMTYAQHPYDEWDNQTVLDQLEAGYRLEKPHKCPQEVYEIMLDCWDKELSNRPGFEAILKRLSQLLHTDSSPSKRPPKKPRSEVNSATNPLHCKTVDNWLESVKMDRYIPMFQDNGITSVNQLVHLTEPDLRDMGITLAGHLHRLTQSIENGYMELKRTSTVGAP